MNLPLMQLLDDNFYVISTSNDQKINLTNTHSQKKTSISVSSSGGDDTGDVNGRTEKSQDHSVERCGL